MLKGNVLGEVSQLPTMFRIELSLRRRKAFECLSLSSANLVRGCFMTPRTIQTRRQYQVSGHDAPANQASPSGIRVTRTIVQPMLFPQVLDGLADRGAVLRAPVLTAMMGPIGNGFVSTQNNVPQELKEAS